MGFLQHVLPGCFAFRTYVSIESRLLLSELDLFFLQSRIISRKAGEPRVLQMQPPMTSQHTKANFEADGVAAVDQLARGAFRFANPRNQPSPPVANTVAVSQPPKTRPRGRILIVLLLLLSCSAGIATVWDSLLRYRAYGVVTGRIIEVGVPVDGVLTSVHVSEGDVVRQDARLAKVSDLEFEQQLERVCDELRIADATLQAEMAKVQWQTHVEETEMTKSIAELFETAGRMHEEHGSLDVLRYHLEQTKELHAKKAVPASDLDTCTIQVDAKREQLDSIQQAIVVLKERAQRAVASPRPGAEQLQPMIAKSEMLLNEIARLRQRIAQGELRSPVNGTILRRHHPAGECIKSAQPLFSVLEESSLEIEIFLPQKMSDEYKVGDTIEVKIDPFEELVACEVIAIGAEHRRPPENIEIFYRSHIRLLPIRLKPLGKFATEKRLSVGSVAKLPYTGNFL